MSIRFACQHCQHPIEVDDALQGRHGKCKHCGRELIVPAAEEPQADSSLHLQPPDENEPVRGVARLLATPEALKLQPSGPERETWSKAVSRPDQQLESTGASRYAVVAAAVGRPARRSGPTPIWLRLPSWSARLVARGLRKARDFLYLISVASLVAVLLGFLFKAKAALHLGAAVIMLANGGMLCVGLAYIVTLPFKESLQQGLFCLLIPGYVAYYWATRWKRMRRPVLNTLSAFVPILLVALAYVFYKEEPALKSTFERELPQLERRVDKELERLDSSIVPSNSPAQRNSSARAFP